MPIKTIRGQLAKDGAALTGEVELTIRITEPHITKRGDSHLGEWEGYCELGVLDETLAVRLLNANELRSNGERAEIRIHQVALSGSVDFRGMGPPPCHTATSSAVRS